MVLLGIGVVWSFYTLGWKGWQTLHSCNTPISDLVLPGKFKPCTPTGSKPKAPAPPSTTTTTGTTTTTTPGGKAPVLNTPPTVPPGWQNPFATGPR